MMSLIWSASMVPEPILSRRCLWRDDVPREAKVSVGWAGLEWTAVAHAQATVEIQDRPVPVALRVRDDATSREWTIPVVDASGRVCWVPPKYDTFDDVLAALLDFPIRPADATSEDDEEADDDGDGGATPNGKPRRSDGASKTYALHAAAELIEKTAALQRALPVGMLDDWFEHLDRMLRASFPDALIATWVSHRINVFTHLRDVDLRPPDMTEKQRAVYFGMPDRAANTWGLQWRSRWRRARVFGSGPDGVVVRFGR